MTYAPTDLSGMDLSEYDMYTYPRPAADLLHGRHQLGQPPGGRFMSTPRDWSPSEVMRTAGTLTDFVRMFDPRLFFAFDNCLREDEEQKARVTDMQLKNGSITINQANQESQWPPAST